MTRLFRCVGTSAVVVIMQTTACYAKPPDVIVTPEAVFTSCTEALSYRDGVLAGKLDAAFRRVAAGVQDRVDATVKDFQRHLTTAEKSYSAAASSQKKEIGVAVAKFVFLKILSHGLKEAALKRVNGTDAVTAKAYDVLADRAVGLADIIQKAAFKKNVEALDVANVNIDTLSIVLGKISKVTVGIVQLGLDVSGAWMEWEPLKAAAAGEFKVFDSALKKLVQGSPREQMKLVNETRRIIDEQCRR